MASASGPGVTGVRLADGRQVFIEGAPEDLEPGTRVTLRWADREDEGVVSVPPRLIAWRDPAAQLGEFLHVVAAAPTLPVDVPEPPLALFLADEGAPDAAHLVRMLSLARAELHRLDD
ncbi:MAG: hypothetical protein ACRDIE_01745 [Chloroflexota bacterium]